jgi:LAS superfamily LD-carboxypeptidase LdcB
MQVLVVALAAAVVSTPALSSASRPGVAQTDPSEEREQVRAKKAEVASKVDALRADDAEIQAALADLEENVAGQEALLGEAERAAAEADAAHADAMAAVDAKTAEIEKLKVKVREFAVEAFIRPPDDDAMTAMEADSPSDAAEKKALLALQSERDVDILDQLSAAQEDLEVQQELAEEAAAQAEEKRQAVASRLAEVTEARDQQAAFAVEVQKRIDHSLSEIAGLEKLDRQLSEEIRKQQEELARQAALQRAAELAAQRAAQQAAQQAAAQAAQSAPAGPPAGVVSSPSGGISSVSCPGGGSISVASSIAGNLGSLLQAASSSGVMLCGGGYRSSASQVALRQAHCGSSYYAIYQAPSSSCSPPTAPPGSSLHEQGLAVDFTCNGGGAISSRSSPCFSWLAANAASYGLYNLPSEPWHWSTNGN